MTRMQREQWMQRFWFWITWGPISRRSKPGNVRRRLDHVGEVDALVERVVLQQALAGLVAHRAVERVIGEQELHDRVARLADALRGVRLDHHAVGHRGGAGDREAGLALDLDHADPALADDRQVRVVAEVGDVDAGEAGGFDQVGAGRDLDSRGHRW